MDMFDWGLTAAAAFLFLYAARVLFQTGKEGESPKLGCGFGILAAGLWMYVLNRHTGDFVTPARIGVGVLLVLPAMQTLAKPTGGSVVRGVLGLVLAFVIAGPAVQDLWNRYGPDDRPTAVIGLQESLTDLKAARASLAGNHELLTGQSDAVRVKVLEYGTSWDQIQSSEAALSELTALRIIEERLVEIEGSLAMLNAKIPEVEAQIAAATSETQEQEIDPELELLLLEIRSEPALEDLPLDEQYERQAELQELFAREF